MLNEEWNDIGVDDDEVKPSFDQQPQVVELAFAAISRARYDFRDDYCSVEDWIKVFNESSQEEIDKANSIFTKFLEEHRREAEALSNTYQIFRTAIHQVEAEKKIKQQQKYPRQVNESRKQSQEYKKPQVEQKQIYRNGEEELKEIQDCNMSPDECLKWTLKLRSKEIEELMKKYQNDSAVEFIEYAYINKNNADPIIAEDCIGFFKENRKYLLKHTEEDMKSLITTLLDHDTILTWKLALILLKESGVFPTVEEYETIDLDNIEIPEDTSAVGKNIIKYVVKTFKDSKSYNPVIADNAQKNLIELKEIIINLARAAKLRNAHRIEWLLQKNEFSRWHSAIFLILPYADAMMSLMIFKAKLGKFDK